MHLPAPVLRTGGRARRTGRRGHTLIELLIVLSLMAVLAGMSMPRLNFVSMRVEANARKVRAMLQQAWRMSVQKQHDVIISFDVAGKRVRTLEDMNGDGLPTTGERITWRPLEEGVGFGVPATGINGAVTTAIAGAGLKTVNSMPSVIFRRNGSTSGDVEIYIMAQNHALEEWRAITIAQATGRTEWYRRVNHVWVWRSGGI